MFAPEPLVLEMKTIEGHSRILYGGGQPEIDFLNTLIHMQTFGGSPRERIGDLQ
jgi:hypothetical protein